MIFWLSIIPLILSSYKLRRESANIKKRVALLDELDDLTGAYNRKTGTEIFETIVKNNDENTRPLSVFIVDIKNLDHINKKNGFSSGDNLIKIVKNILSLNFRETDIVIRSGADKFIVLLPGCDKICRATLVKTLQQRLLNFNALNKKDYFLTLHMLFCEYHGEDTQEFIEKSANLFRLHKKKQKFLDLLLQEEMLDGLNKGEFQTFFQPKIFSEEKNIEFEALVRWFHPEKGMISPEIFIPIAEKDFVIHKITEKVLKDSIEFAQKINSKISVNISPVVFQNINFLKDMEEIFKNREIAELITLEITEGVALNDYSNAVEKMNAIKKIGLELSIDDFGTGYSSLSYLENFPISELKIDKSFIRNLHTNKINPLIINFVVKLGKIAGFKVIAEGVETEKDIKTLMSLGCYNFQGFYFDKPQPSEIIYEKYSSNVYGDMIDKLKNNLL
jgi:diguanylate cyclase (GGDEF)-like protein